MSAFVVFFFFQAEDGIRDVAVTGVQTCALPISDFGQTLGIWGVGPGPYLVLPFLPPLTVRDGVGYAADGAMNRSEEHTSELQSRLHLVCRLLLEKKNCDSVMQFTTQAHALRCRA